MAMQRSQSVTNRQRSTEARPEMNEHFLCPRCRAWKRMPWLCAQHVSCTDCCEEQHQSVMFVILWLRHRGSTSLLISQAELMNMSLPIGSKSHAQQMKRKKSGMPAVKDASTQTDVIKELWTPEKRVKSSDELVWECRQSTWQYHRERAKLHFASAEVIYVKNEKEEYWDSLRSQHEKDHALQIAWERHVRDHKVNADFARENMSRKIHD